MDPYFRPTRVEISLDALQHNYMAFRQALPDSIKIMTVGGREGQIQQYG